MGTRPSQGRLTPEEAQRLAEQDVAFIQARPETLELLDGSDELIAEIDELLVERSVLMAFAQWEGE